MVQINKFKDLFKFDIKLDNGDSGTIYRQKDHAGVQEGETITYTLNDKGSINIDVKILNFNSLDIKFFQNFSLFYRIYLKYY